MQKKESHVAARVAASSCAQSMRVTPALAMGWNISADVRAALLGKHVSLEDTPRGSAAPAEVVIDGNANGRSLAVGQRRAAAVAAQMLAVVGEGTQQVVFCFDNDNVPDVRKREVHATRAKRSAASATVKRLVPATADEIDDFTGSGEIEWERMFATAAGKRKALLVLCRALKEAIVRNADAASSRAPCRFTLTSPDASHDDFASAIWAYPFDAPSKFAGVLCETKYGEAEAQVVACIRHSLEVAAAAGEPAPTTQIHTIDTDVYLQCLSFAHPHLSVVIGVVWKTSDGETHSSAARARTASAALRAAKRRKTSNPQPEPSGTAATSVTKVQRLYKHVSLSGFAAAAFDSAVDRMINAQWWFLLTGGCDYNFTGLAALGWNHKTCVKLSERAVIKDDALQLGRFARELRTTRNARRKNTEISRFCEMLARTVYCWHYYQWKGAQPELAQFADRFTVGESETISDWLVAVPEDATTSMLPAATSPL